jgi:DNA repair protein RadA/Sms
MSQVRECTSIILRLAKENQVAIFIVGHVTKDGSIAGPKLLEHMVDTVLYFEGDSNFTHRIIRTIKNRFGPSDEIAIMSMSDSGLSEISNATGFFISQNDRSQCGTTVVPVREGSRILLMELEALVNNSHFGMPQRVASGINQKKLALILAVLERYAGLLLGDQDIFFNISGGMSVSEPAIDVALAAALISSFQNRPVRQGMTFIGEIGLSGKLREVNGMEQRIKEVAAIGFKECLIPTPAKKSKWFKIDYGIELVKCNFVNELEHLIF